MNMSKGFIPVLACTIGAISSFAWSQMAQHIPVVQWTSQGGDRGKAFPMAAVSSANAVSRVNNVSADAPQGALPGQYPVWNSGFRSAGYHTLFHAMDSTPAFSGRALQHIGFQSSWGVQSGTTSYSNLTATPPPPGVTFGSRLPISLLAAPSPGDFLDPSPTLGGSSLALVSNAAATQPSTWQGLGRPTIDEAVDAVTGLPLAKVCDLELPFGNATFRLIRTRSYSRAEALSCDPGAVADQWWDWAGLGWMISENPLLLVDSQISRSSPSQSESVDNDPLASPVRTTWLILDAHRSIPFQQKIDNGNYETSPRFRATLTHNGAWNAGSWSKHPTWYKVSLYDGEITYTFVSITSQPDGIAQYDPKLFAEDVPLTRFDEASIPDPALQSPALSDGSAALSPSFNGTPTEEAAYVNPMDSRRNRGFGLPTLGLCTRIEDRYGHAAVMHYAPVNQWPLAGDNGTGLVPVFQNTFRRGQLSHVTLHAPPGTNGPAPVEWTIVYAYRQFVGQGGWLRQARQANSAGFGEWLNKPSGADPFAAFRDDLECYDGSLAIDAIYAVRGPVSALSSETAASPLNVSQNVSYKDANNNVVLADIEYTDPLTRYNTNNASSPFLLDWKHKVRHFYAFDNRQTLSPGSTVNDRYGIPVGAPILLKTVVTSRETTLPTNQSRVVSNETVYQYNNMHDTNNSGIAQPLRLDSSFCENGWNERVPAYQSAQMPWLTHIYRSSELAKLSSVNFRGSTCSETSKVTVDELVTRTSSDQCQIERIDAAGVLASVEWQYSPIGTEWPTSGSGSLYSPSLTDLLDDQYLPELNLEAGSPGRHHIVPDFGFSIVHRVTLRHGESETAYQLNRMLVRPTPPGGPSGVSGAVWADAGADGCDLHPSATTLPYTWSAFPNASLGQDSVLTSLLVPDSKDIRYAVVADAFSNHQSLISINDGYQGSVRAGQVSRRVLTLSASGVTLRDRVWNFKNGESSSSGEGLGKRYEYDKLKDIFGWVNNQNIPKLVQDQIVAVQERSVGWSALPEDQGSTQGLVVSNHYTFFAPDLTAEGSIPWSQRLQLHAKSIQKGTNDPGQSGRRYIKQYFYDGDGSNSPDARPADLIAEIDFLTPASSTIPTAPAFGNQINDAVSVSHVKRQLHNEGSSVPRWRLRVKHVEAASPPRQTSNGNISLFPYVAESFNDEGAVEWRAAGLVPDVTTPYAPSAIRGSGVTLTYTQYTGDGKLEAVVEDAVPGATVSLSTPRSEYDPPLSLIVPQPAPYGMARVALSDTGAPLNRLTWYEYRGAAGELSDIWYPTGRRWAKRTFQYPGLQPSQVNSDTFYPDVRTKRHTETFVFSDAIKADSGWITLSPIKWELRIDNPTSTRFASFGQGGLSGTMRGNSKEPAAAEQLLTLSGGVLDFDNPQSSPSACAHPSAGGSATFTVLAKKTFVVNQQGRIIQTNLAERNINGLVVEIGERQTNNLVDMRRDRDIDGTIHRETRDFFGHWLRRYRGTGDMAWDHNSLGAYNELSNNLVLTERQEWGKGVNDAWLPTVHRRYDRVPSGDGFSNPYAKIDPDQDQDGYPTVTQYDWRMRPVRVDSYDKGIYNPTGDPPVAPTRLSTSLTYLDFQSRPVLEVSFGAGELTLGSLDPVTFEPTFTIPAPSDFFSCGIRPLSITQHIYAKDGTEYETRTYDVGWDSTGTLPYQSTITYRGLNNEVIYSHSPGQPVSIKIQHPAGHVIKSITAAPDANAATSDRYELSRTDFIHDPASLQVIDQSSWERTLSTGNALSVSNAVRTRELTWYDPRGRVTATADIGTESTTYTSASTTLPRPMTGPALTFASDTFSYSPVATLAEISARVSTFCYDNEGNQIGSRDPSGSITRTWYTGRGMVAKQTEAFGTPLARTKTYEYRWNRLVGIKFQSTADTTPDPSQFQETRSHYAHTENIQIGEPPTSYTATVAAPVVDHDFNQISANASMVAKVWFPHRQNGSYNLAPGQFFPTTSSDLSFKYNIMGQIAERLDARGVVFRYTYDAQARLSKIDVGHYDGSNAYTAGYPPEMNCATGIPVDRIQRVDFTYDERGNQYAVTARGPPSLPNFPDGIVITQNVAAYSNRDDLIKEWQSYGTAAITSGTGESPNTQYDWAYAANSGTPTAPSFNRLTKMTYPMPTGGVTVIGSSPPRREVNFAYGSSTASSPSAPGWLDHRFSRITQMTSGLTGSTAVTDISGFEYSGTSRRMTHTMAGGKIARTSRADPSSAGLDHLDQFGRAKVFAFNATNGPNTATPLYRADYGYDAAGNRTLAAVVERNGTQNPVPLEVLSGYDALQRLTSTEHKLFDSGTSSLVPRRLDAWNLDLLGNWVGGSGTTTPPGRLITDPSDANAVLGSVDVAINQRNEPGTSSIKGETTSGTPLTSNIRHDICGNLVFDGQFYYQYDAWNRLIQINKAAMNTSGGNVEPESLTPNPCPPTDLIIGPMAKLFTYDGVGRLIRVQSPFPNPESSTGAVRSERFYYDGARRIQEIVTDPLATIGLAEDPEGEANNPGLGEQLNNSVPEGQQQSGDPEGAPLSFEQSQMQQQENEPQPLIDEGGDPLPVTLGGAEREYIWGPGDGPAGIDEILVQFDINRAPWWMLQDAGGDLVAMCDIGGTGVGGSARVVHTYQFDAYGQCLRANQLVANSTNFTVPYTRLGHKGLFLDRIDVGVASGNSTSGFFDNPRVVGGGYGSGGSVGSPAGSVVRYQVRNRTYLPEFGLWGQRDPNQSGQTTLWTFESVREPIHPSGPSLDVNELYRDGGSLRQYALSAPLQHRDPFGLFEASLIGLGLVSTTAVDLQLDYNDEVIDNGIEAYAGASAFMNDAADEQMFKAIAALDWNAPDDLFGPATESYFSGSDLFGGPAIAMAQPFDASGQCNHHLATKYGDRGKKYIRLFKTAGLEMDGAENLMKMAWQDHKGPGHSKEYWDFVDEQFTDAKKYARIADNENLPAAVRGEARTQANNLLRSSLNNIRNRLTIDPGILRRYRK